MKVELIETGVDVGPAIYLARTFDTDVDTVVKFFIFILIFVFDPMALAMVLAWNTAIGRKSYEVYKEEDDRVEKIYNEYKSKKEPEVVEQVIERVVEDKIGKGGVITNI